MATAQLGSMHEAGVPEAGLSSALYTGTLHHSRHGPGPRHRFTYRVAMPLLYLDEIDRVAASHPLWSSRHPAPVWLRRDDFLGAPGTALDGAVRGLVAERTGLRPAGRVALLANVRTWGWLFNPISLYFCLGASGGTETLVADVENTPWHEHHYYVMGSPGEHRFAKEMHVSPFLPMGTEYRLSYTAPGEDLRVQLDLLGAGQRLLTAVLSLQRSPLDRRAMSAYLRDYPAMAHRVSAGIYTQAARLVLKGAPLFTHPDKTGRRRRPTRSTEQEAHAQWTSST